MSIDDEGEVAGVLDSCFSIETIIKTDVEVLTMCVWVFKVPRPRRLANFEKDFDMTSIAYCFQSMQGGRDRKE